MSGIKEKLMTFFNAFLSHPACVSNTVLLGITTGFEQLWERLVFRCPEKPSNVDKYSWNQCYSVAYLLAPALALWMIGGLGSNTAWRLCQGLKYRQQPHECNSFNVLAIALRTVLVPLVWIFVALMDGDFYACYMYLPSCSEGNSPVLVSEGESPVLVAGVNCTNNIIAWNYEKKYQSQLIGWVYLLVCLVIGSCVLFCGRYRSKRTYFPHLYSNQLRIGERKLIEKLLTEQAEKEGKKNADAFITKFASEDPVPASHWESICREYTKEECNIVIDEKQQSPTGEKEQAAAEELVYYSPLSEFLNSNAK